METKANAVYVEKLTFERLFLDDVDVQDLSPSPGPPSTSFGSPQSSVYSNVSSPSSSYSPYSSPLKAGHASSSKSFKKKDPLFLAEIAREEHKSQAKIAKALKRAIERQQFEEEKRFSSLTSSYEESRRLLTEVDRELALVSTTQQTKTRRQFEDWNTNVHGKIVKKIADQIAQKSPQELHENKLVDYQNFLDVINRKKTVFRDIIIEAEYDPLEVNRRSLKATTGILKDPTLIDQQKLESERGVALARGDELGKECLSVETWASGKIHATPFGRGPNQYIDPLPPKINPTQTSNVFMDDYDFPVGSDAVSKEMPLGKRTFPPR